MNLDRRELLKLTALLSASTIFNPAIKLQPNTISTDPNTPNILIFVFDALSAENMSMYGYPRETTPHLSRLLDQATIFHNHYSGDNYTTPGTTSLLTGTLAWKNRVFKLLDTPAPEFKTKNLFSLFEHYYRVAYTHNPAAEIVLDHFTQAITYHKSFEELFATNNWLTTKFFKRDYDSASLGWIRHSNSNLDGLTYSLLFAEEIDNYFKRPSNDLIEQFPRGVPTIGHTRSAYTLEDAINWIKDSVLQFQKPLLGYFHLYPPHNPFNTRIDFYNKFENDGYDPPQHNIHPMKPTRDFPENQISGLRRSYDEFILYLDAEFGRLFEYLDNNNILDNTYVVFTSDHGEMFDRGMANHASALFFQPLVHIPLIIFEPGQKIRKDIYTNTSCIDIIPTLLQITGQPIPDWLEGNILPPYRQDNLDNSHNIFAIHGKPNPEQYGEILAGTMMLVKNQLKCIRYFGYETYAPYFGIKMDIDPLYEVFNLEEDPEEINNLANTRSKEVNHIIQEMEEKYSEIRYPYTGQTN